MRFARACVSPVKSGTAAADDPTTDDRRAQQQIDSVPCFNQPTGSLLTVELRTGPQSRAGSFLGAFVLSIGSCSPYASAGRQDARWGRAITSGMFVGAAVGGPGGSMQIYIDTCNPSWSRLALIHFSLQPDDTQQTSMFVVVDAAAICKR
jgi:hypothetical protein